MNFYRFFGSLAKFKTFDGKLVMVVYSVMWLCFNLVLFVIINMLLKNVVVVLFILYMVEIILVIEYSSIILVRAATYVACKVCFFLYLKFVLLICKFVLVFILF